MNIGHDGAGDEPNDDLRILTRINGEEVRLLVHIEPIAGTGPGDGAQEEPRHDPPAMGQ